MTQISRKKRPDFLGQSITNVLLEEDEPITFEDLFDKGYSRYTEMCAGKSRQSKDVLRLRAYDKLQKMVDAGTLIRVRSEGRPAHFALTKK